MVTHSDERIPATLKVRGKRSHGCRNYATRRRTQSLTISRSILTCRCKLGQLGLQQAKAKRTKLLRCSARPRMPKTFWANIQFHRARLFLFANNSEVCCSKQANRRKHSENSKLRSKSTRGGSGVYMERLELPSKLATRKMRAAITPNLRHKRQSLVAHGMS